MHDANTRNERRRKALEAHRAEMRRKQERTFNAYGDARSAVRQSTGQLIMPAIDYCGFIRSTFDYPKLSRINAFVPKRLYKWQET